VRFDIDDDVLRGRTFDFAHKFLPDGLSRVRQLDFLDDDGQRRVSQVRGRTYANMFGFIERLIAAKALDLSRNHWFGDQKALEAVVRFTDEEIKHQEMFRRIEAMIGAGMPAGYTFNHDANAVASVVLGKCNWAVLALICHVEIFVLTHYRESIDREAELSPLWKDVFFHHAREEAQHAILDEMEWDHEDHRIDAAARDLAVDDLIALVAAVDGILQLQARADADYFVRIANRRFPETQVALIRAQFLDAYRWQYIGLGVRGRFTQILAAKITPTQLARVQTALAPIVG
jgi:hypothetical protein